MGSVGLLFTRFDRLPVRKLLLIAIPFYVCRRFPEFKPTSIFQRLSKSDGLRAREAAGKVLSSYQRHKIKFYEDWLANDKPSESDQAEYTDWMRDSYASAFESAAEETFTCKTDYIISQRFWEVMGMMLLGMALLKYSGSSQHNGPFASYALGVRRGVGCWLA